jgi:hypothetical protein
MITSPAGIELVTTLPLPRPAPASALLQSMVALPLPSISTLESVRLAFAMGNGCGVCPPLSTVAAALIMLVRSFRDT